MKRLLLPSFLAWLRNFVVCVEVKHMDEKLISKDKTGHIIWRSNQKYKNISLQNKKQVDGLGQHIGNTLRANPEKISVFKEKIYQPSLCFWLHLSD